ncbi:E3 ubiquitin-protein ligase BRE1A, partial [Reticulomyxa filosa]
GRANHASEDCLHKKNKKRQRCILCKGNHASDSIICPVIQKTRQQIGINLSRREKQIIQKKEQAKQPEKPKIQPKSEKKNKKEERKIPIHPPRQNKNSQQKRNEQKKVESEEIKQLKTEMAELRASMTEMMTFFQQFAIAFQQQQDNDEDTNDETSINEYDQ